MPISMIKLVAASPSGERSLDLRFSDGATARWSADEIIARNTVLTAPLSDPAYFARAFVEAGALAWPNGLELAPSALYRKLERSGALHKAAA